MENVKKMMLIDSNFATGDFKNVKRHYSLLDQNISDVLNRQDIDDHGKLILYRNALTKFLINRQTIEKEIEDPLKVQTASPQQSQIVEDVTPEPIIQIPQLEEPKITKTVDKISKTNKTRKKIPTNIKKYPLLVSRRKRVHKIPSWVSL
jgi:hypothetical protein